MGAPKATDAAMRRVINAWKDAGLTIGRMEVTPEGRIIITAPDVDKPENGGHTARPKQWRNIG